MDKLNPALYQSTTDYLLALGFIIDTDNGSFVRQSCKIPFVEIIGFTPISFAEKAEKRGWFNEQISEDTSDIAYGWGNQFLFVVFGGFLAD